MRIAFSRCRTVNDLDEIITSIPGVFHAVAHIGGHTRVQGTASGERRVFYSRFQGCWLAADRATSLARLTHASVDDAAIALRLLEPVPHPLSQRVPWQGVHAVPPGHWLHLTDQGQGQVRRWWQPPVPEQPLAVGARAVQEALRSSVRLHLRGRTKVSSELSGGFDSTALLFLAQEEHRTLAVTAASRDPLDEDEAWAVRAVRDSHRVDHRIVPASQLPLVYAELDGAAEQLDEPSIAIASRARVLAMTREAQAEGSQVHLTGHGGDHLFVGLATLYADLVRRHPVIALRRIAAYRGMFAWSWPHIARQLLAPRSFRTWLATESLSGTGADWKHPFLTWGLGATAPPWLTAQAHGLIRDEVRAATATARPLAPGPGRHLELDGIRDGARLVRALTDITGHAGLPISAPFFDDRVIEAALAVRVPDRVQPHLYKPLLAAAMRGVVPDPLLARTTKGVGDLDQALGLRKNAVALNRLWSDSRLAARGLIDPGRLSALCAQPDSPELDDGSLLTTVACELWLRSLDTESATPRSENHGTALA
ncbi:asparagine synthase-related protein [Streptomyces sp. HUAS TT7]|uniref:asparagine synthase-related protein n=1 Tax=Streptomyces sp. HUAS TT7 TaxID=3447507 RepID=UPI003F65BBE6